jgi:hypothetical protein
VTTLPAGIALIAGEAGVGLLDAWASSPGQVYGALCSFRHRSTAIRLLLRPSRLSDKVRGFRTKRPGYPANVVDRDVSLAPFH